jgi:hypothetical protein
VYSLKGREYIGIDVRTRGLALQERILLKNPVDDGCRAVVVVLGLHPVADARQVHGARNPIRKLSGELGRDFPGFVSDQLGTAIDCRYAGHAAVLPEELNGMCFKP